MRCVSILAMGLAGCGMSAEQSLPRLTLELADYAAMPVTAQPGGENTMAQLSRVNFLRDEPGGERFFVNDLNGPLYILDKQTKTFTTYLDFNGAGGRPGLFRRFFFERNFATGLTNVLFDPDYANNGVFYTLHFEDPAVGGSAAPRPGVVVGLDLSGYQTTAPIPPTRDYEGEIEAEVVLIEWTDRDLSSLVDLMSAFYEESGYPLHQERARAAFTELLSEPRFGSVWLIEWDSDVAGYVVLTLGYSMEYGGRDAFVDDLYVRPRYRGKGLGRLAISTVRATCEAQGVRALHLEVGHDNTVARRLYAGAGFQDNDRKLLTLRLAEPAHGT